MDEAGQEVKCVIKCTSTVKRVWQLNNKRDDTRYGRISNEFDLSCKE